MNTIIFHDYQAQQRRGKYSHSRQNCLFLLRKHRDGRQNASANGRSSPTADRVHDAAGRCTLTGDRVLATIAETLRQPTECTTL